MATLSAMHPRVGEFIQCKDVSNDKNIYNFNISVVIRDADIKNNPKQIKEVLRLVSESSWRSGDPGVIFLDRILDGLPYDDKAAVKLLGPIQTVVPCGEQAMHRNETCTVGSINIAADDFWDGDRFRNDIFRETVELGVRVLDAAHKKLDYAGDTALMATSNLTKRLGLGPGYA